MSLHEIGPQETNEIPKAWSAMTNRTPARDRLGALGWRRGELTSDEVDAINDGLVVIAIIAILIGLLIPLGCLLLLRM